VTRRPFPAWIPAAILLLTVAQLAVAEWWPGIDRFADKAFGARLVAYPLLMLLAPAIWWLAERRPMNRTGTERPTADRPTDEQPPYAAFSLVMLPFLVDVTGNSLDLYDSIVWWDDFNHYINWLFLLVGIGMLVADNVQPDWAMVVLVTGLGALLAIGWELGEWYTFIRHGTEIETAYEDTLGDMTLGTLGALCAALLLLWRRRAAVRTSPHLVA
jgi:hypothetical protein